ncbi:hypothetical protein GVAMD_0520 [Gardnerella vaginalis AMD]|nr:hypothetical protein GVAMD_0520 [Gardnerella vaginalis AMD]
MSWGWDVLINSLHELLDGLYPLLVIWSVIVQSTVSRGADDWAVAIEAVFFEEVTNLFFDEVDKFWIINHIALVQSNEDLRDTDLLSEQNVLTGLSHRTIGSSNHEDCAIHLSSTGDHVLHVISVAWSVHVSVVTLSGLILDVCDVNGNAAFLLFWSGINLIEVILRVQIWILAMQHLRNSRGQGSLTVINVTNGTNVNMRLSTLVLFLCHVFVLLDVS